VRNRLILSFSGLAVCVASMASAQTAPLPQAPASMPAPTVEQNGTTPARGPYGSQQPTTQPAAPTPQTAPPPAVPKTPENQQNTYPAYVPYGPLPEDIPKRAYGSTYIPVDSWMYPALNQLYGMGFVDTMFLGMKPYTRQSVMHILQDSQPDIINSNNELAKEILAKLLTELAPEVPRVEPRGVVYGLRSGYTRFMGITGPTLRDSFHLGQTIVSDRVQQYNGIFDGE
jgi:hypothetical protein